LDQIKAPEREEDKGNFKQSQIHPKYIFREIFDPYKLLSITF
jgi:hypothetical protein